MRISKAVTSILLLISLIFLAACEQESGTDTAGSARISFKANEHDKEFGNYIIHVNAITTDQLPTEIARGYKISRSKNQAMLNVSVRKKSANGEMPVSAKVSVVARNLTNQLKNVTLREIKETDPIAIYYIGEVSVNNDETLVFDLDVIPEGSNEPALLTYRQRFFTE